MQEAIMLGLKTVVESQSAVDMIHEAGNALVAYRALGVLGVIASLLIVGSTVKTCFKLCLDYHRDQWKSIRS